MSSCGGLAHVPTALLQVLRQSGVLTVRRIGSWGRLLSLGRWGPWVPSSTSAPCPSSLAPYLQWVAWHRPLWACGPDVLCPEGHSHPAFTHQVPIACPQNVPRHSLCANHPHEDRWTGSGFTELLMFSSWVVLGHSPSCSGPDCVFTPSAVRCQLCPSGLYGGTGEKLGCLAHHLELEASFNFVFHDFF